MSALKRSEFEAMFEGRHQPGAKFTITGTDAARLKITIDEGFAPDACHVCGEHVAYKGCDVCGRYACAACQVSDEFGVWLCTTCAEVPQ